MDNTEEKLQKKNVAFETVKSVCLYVGGLTILSTIANSIYNSYKAKSIKPYDPIYIGKYITNSSSAFFGACIGIVGFSSAIKHNKEVDKFTNKLEQEKSQSAENKDLPSH